MDPEREPMESKPQPSLLQGAQHVHEPAAAEPGEACECQGCESLNCYRKFHYLTPYDEFGFEGVVPTAGQQVQPVASFHHPCSKHDPFAGQVDWSVNRGPQTHNPDFPNGIYFCLVAYCGTTFPNHESLDLHYKLVHSTPYDQLGFEGVVPTAGQPSQPVASFHPTANLAHNDYNNIGASLHDPLVGQVDWSVNRGLQANNPDFHDGFRTHQRSQSPTPSSFINKPHTYVVDGDQPLNAPAPLLFTPTEAASTVVGPPNSSTDPPPRHVCATCSKPFGRASDMQRHAKKHDRHAQRMDCPFPDCVYKGAKGFLRSDKLGSHVNNRH